MDMSVVAVIILFINQYISGKKQIYVEDCITYRIQNKTEGRMLK